jgi:hypothetical protein
VRAFVVALAVPKQARIQELALKNSGKNQVLERGEI